MESYPEQYVAHNLPLIVLAGLPQADQVKPLSEDLSSSSNGASLTSDVPSLSGSLAEQVLDQFLRLDGASLPWSEFGLSGRNGLIGFNITSVGRVGRTMLQFFSSLVLG